MIDTWPGRSRSTSTNRFRRGTARTRSIRFSGSASSASVSKSRVGTLLDPAFAAPTIVVRISGRQDRRPRRSHGVRGFPVEQAQERRQVGPGHAIEAVDRAPRSGCANSSTERDPRIGERWRFVHVGSNVGMRLARLADEIGERSDRRGPGLESALHLLEHDADRGRSGVDEESSSRDDALRRPRLRSTSSART